MSSADRIEAMEVRTGTELSALASLVPKAIAEEGRPLSDADKQVIVTIINTSPRHTDPKRLAATFGKLKEIALRSKAGDTADAITSAAYWFWKNVESVGTGFDQTAKSTLQRQSGSQQPLRDEPPAPPKDVPLMERPWFLPVVAVGVPVLTLGILLLVTRGGQKEAEVALAPA